ncbi:unnamed protein product [Lactuca virosa]|uniref:Uncharacterized protein n=1 Tax=Lactuca virosa TaxID=75947 RepID=A0AAU9PER1_9ASTR|nr:unnamed protein product [Lactuca virosa]
MAIYNKDVDVVTFQMESKGTKKLVKKQFTQILQLSAEGPFEVPSFDQVLPILNEMGYNPPISVISDFRKSKLPILWSFFFGVMIHCLTGRNSSLDKAKLQLYCVMVVLYYGLKIDYDSLLWDEFTTYVKHSKKASEIASARFWSLIL